MAETLAKAKLDSVVVDSAATGSWHVGNRADPRALSTLQKHGLESKHIVRQITKQDFYEFDYIFGMDEDNMSDLRRLAPKDCKAELLMLGDFGLSKEKRIIEDPYYVSSTSYKLQLELISTTCSNAAMRASRWLINSALRRVRRSLSSGCCSDSRSNMFHVVDL